MGCAACGLRKVYAFLTDIGEAGAVTKSAMETKATSRPGPDVTQTPLPAERAFVVQLRAQADPGEELVVGRAEHIASGAAVCFGSAEELIAFITNVLAPAGSSPGKPSASKVEGGKTG